MPNPSRGGSSSGGSSAHSGMRPRLDSARRRRGSVPTAIAARLPPCESRALPDDHMRRALARDRFVDRIAERAKIEPAEQALAFSEQDRPHREMHFIDEPGLEVLADRRDAAAEAHVARAGGRFRACE